jgi:hypothetical protein
MENSRFSLPTCLAFMIITLALCGCSGSPPEVLDLEFQVNAVKDRELDLVSQKLSLFILPNDPDGYEDLDIIYIIHDSDELFWSLKSDEWQKVARGQDTWIGSNSICMPDNSDLPSGRYRILLKDLSGEKAEERIFIKKRDIITQRISFPDSEVRNGRIFVAGDYEESEILVYEREQVFKRSFLSREEGLSLGEIFSKIQDLTYDFIYYLYAYDGDLEMGIISGPYSP